MAETSIETKTILFWTNLYWRTAPGLTSWSHCSNDIKGSCVLTNNKSQYQVCVVLLEIIVKILANLLFVQLVHNLELHFCKIASVYA